MIGIAGSGGVGAWAAFATDWLVAYGPIAWMGAAAGGIILFLLARLIWNAAALNFAKRRLFRIYEQAPPTINPLDSTFTSKRIDVGVFKMPSLGETIDGKSFIDCEMVGPAVIAFMGSSTLTNVHFHDCDFIKIKQGATVANVLAFKDATIRGGKFYNVTFLIPPNMAASIPPSANWIT